jgi:hypothetical protein
VNTGDCLYPYPHIVRYKLDPCPRSAADRHERLLDFDSTKEHLLRSVAPFSSPPPPMASYTSWVSNPEESHGPLMSVVTWSLVSVAAAFLIPRLFIRQHQGKLWLDDCTLSISWVSTASSRDKHQSLIQCRSYFWSKSP